MNQVQLNFIKEMVQVGAVAVSTVESEVYGAAGLDKDDDPFRTQDTLENLGAERYRQDKKWGVQSHSPAKWLAILMEEVGEAAAEIPFDGFGVLHDFVSEIADIGFRIREALNDGSI